MAGSSLLLLIDDIATLLDDIASMSKVATSKTAGVLGDDLALNAEQVTGIRAERELPVVWAVAKGSLWNKAILVPLALLISAFVPWLIVPLLMIGGTFLCFEGAEKLAHSWLHSKAEDEAHGDELKAALVNPNVDMVAFERDRVKGAVRTDFILSAEIITIALGTVAEAPLLTQALTLVVVSLIITVGVYGLVAVIVKLDDMGLWMFKRESAWAQAIGRGLLWLAPALLKTLSVLGTVALFLGGGGIVMHGLGPLHHLLEGWWAMAGAVDWLAQAVITSVFGVLLGLVAVAIWTGVGKLRRA